MKVHKASDLWVQVQWICVCVCVCKMDNSTRIAAMVRTDSYQVAGAAAAQDGWMDGYGDMEERPGQWIATINQQ